MSKNTCSRSLSSPTVVYLCQPSVDRPGWLARAVGLQLGWAESWQGGGLSTCCQLLFGHDTATSRPVPLFRHIEAPRDQEAMQVRQEQPLAELMLQTRIWSASASGDEPWGEARLIRLAPEPTEVFRMVGGGSRTRWRGWASAVAREVGVMLMPVGELRDEEQMEASNVFDPCVERHSRAGHSVLQAHGLTGDPVWVGLLDRPWSTVPQASSVPIAALEGDIETLYRGPRAAPLHTRLEPRAADVVAMVTAGHG